MYITYINSFVQQVYVNNYELIYHLKLQNTQFFICGHPNLTFKVATHARWYFVNNSVSKQLHVVPYELKGHLLPAIRYTTALYERTVVYISNHNKLQCLTQSVKASIPHKRFQLPSNSYLKDIVLNMCLQLDMHTPDLNYIDISLFARHKGSSHLFHHLSGFYIT